MINDMQTCETYNSGDKLDAYNIFHGIALLLPPPCKESYFHIDECSRRIHEQLLDHTVQDVLDCRMLDTVVSWRDTRYKFMCCSELVGCVRTLVHVDISTRRHVGFIHYTGQSTVYIATDSVNVPP